MTTSVAALLARPAVRPRPRRHRLETTSVRRQYRAVVALQRAAGNAAVSALLSVQRDPQKPAPTDVVMILNPPKEKADAATEAALIAPNAQVLYATSVQEMVSKLKALKAPVKTLFFFGHSNADGDIVFERPGRQDFVPAEKIAQSLKGVVQVESIDFHGCAAGVSPKEIDKVKGALKAKKALASTCELVRQVAGPIKAPGGKLITDPSTFDLSKPDNRKLFDTGFKSLHDSFGDDRRKCIINDSEEGYFKAHGKLVAVWANPESIAGNNAFDKSLSICYGDLRREKLDASKNPVIDENKCKLVEL